ncbi:hypothetical protein Tco_0239088 [Tanacetum coccineum]
MGPPLGTTQTTELGDDNLTLEGVATELAPRTDIQEKNKKKAKSKQIRACAGTDIQEKNKKKAKSKQIRARNGKDKVKSQAK